jgi:geranylgeranyl pyrophosphate synthase
LILTAVSVGAQIAGAGAGVLKQVRRYGRYLGLAFQIADDIVDAENVDSRGSGSSDRDRSKATYPSVVGLKGARERVRELTRLGLGQLRDLGPAAEPLRGIAGYVLEQALSGHKKASERLERRIHIG